MRLKPGKKVTEASEVERTKRRSRSSKVLRWVATRGISNVAWTFLRSGWGLAVVGTIIAWVGAVNLSYATRNLAIQTTTFLSANTSPVLYLAGIIIGIGLAYRYPKTVIFIASLALATYYLTPLASTAAIVESYRITIILVSIAFFALATFFLYLKRRRRQRLINGVSSS